MAETYLTHLAADAISEVDIRKPKEVESQTELTEGQTMTSMIDYDIDRPSHNGMS